MKVELYDIGEVVYAIGLKRIITPEDEKNHNWFDIIYEGKVESIRIDSKGIYYGINNFKTEYHIDYLVYNDKDIALQACNYYNINYKETTVSTENK